MVERAVVVGSGPGASTAAMVLAGAGRDVVIFEKGRNLFAGELTEAAPRTLFSNDELKMRRGFGGPDTDGEPRTFRSSPDDVEPLAVGDLNTLPTTVAGGTVHWDAKTPRFWDIDFRKRSMLGPIDGAEVADWPFDYEEIAPYYDVVEQLIGVQGDADVLAEGPAGVHAPRSGPFPMPPGAPMYGSILLAEGARSRGLHPYPFTQAINSQTYDGRPGCIDCGFCSGFGCPIHDRGSALIPLRHALLTGNAELRDESMVTRIEHDGTRATGVRWVDAAGEEHVETADFVVLGAGAIESPRLVLLSDIDDPDGQVGTGTMFHWFTDGFGIWLSERIHAGRGRDSSHAIDDFCDPDFPGARDAAAAAGLPYFRGGIVEMGGTTHLIDEAAQYVELMEIFDADKPFGRRFKELMRLSALRDRLTGAVMISEDLRQHSNRVGLDPAVRDRYGLPVAAVTYAPHEHELAAQEFYTPHLVGLIEAAGADVAGATAQTGTPDRPAPTGSLVPGGAHLMGGLCMSADAADGATDGFGRLWSLDNVGVADASVFPTSGAHNPTLTIFTTALRNARAWAGLEGPPALPAGFEGSGTAGDGGSGGSGDAASAIIAATAGAAALGGAAVVSARRAKRRAQGPHGGVPS